MIKMKLNKFQFAVFRKVAEAGALSPKELRDEFSVSAFRLSRSLNVLKKYDLVRKSGRRLSLAQGFAPVLARFLLDHAGIEQVLADSGLILLQLLEQPKTLGELAQKAGISVQSAYRYLRHFANRGIIKNNYAINTELWPDALQFIAALKLHSGPAEFRIPASAKIYLLEPKKVIFSTDLPVVAELTSFSRYSEFGIHIIEAEKFYRLPKKKLTLRGVFLDSLDCATSTRRRIICTLFYLKHKERLAGITHPELDNIRKTLKGKKIKGYPAIGEIKERAGLYDIKL
jgi:DNA-binding HxlR family transcriptional regulator